MVLLDTETPGISREIYSEDADGETRMVRFYPGILYFICFSQTDGCHPDRFVQCLQQHDMDMDVSPIQVRLRSTESTHTDDNGNSDIDRLTKELCNVLKDHNNVSIQNFVKYSFNYCYKPKLSGSVSD